MQPSFLSDGATARLDASRWTILAKWLGAIQNGLGGGALSANNPSRVDSRYVLLKKINAAKAGVAYTG